MKNKSLSNRVIIYVCTFILLTLLIPLKCFGQIWYFIPEDQNCVPIMLVRDTAGDYWQGIVPQIYSKGISRMDVLQMKLKEDPNTFVNLFNNPNKGFSEKGNRRFAFEDNWYSQASFGKLEIQKITPTEIVFYTGFSVTVDYSTMVAGSERFVLHSYSVDDIVNGRFHTRDTFDYHTTRGISDSSTDTPMNNQRNKNKENSWNKSRTCRKCHGSTTCTQCNGTGKVFSTTYGVNKNITCPACGGSKKCSLCSGSGKENYITP